MVQLQDKNMKIQNPTLQVVEHALMLTQLHATHAPTILALAQQAVEDGSPINRPVILKNKVL